MNEKLYHVSEIFSSFQGEGIYLGTPAVFVRFAGCNLSCPFCDTVDASQMIFEAHELVHHITKLMTQQKITHLVLTGGEPLLQIDDDLLHKLIKIDIDGLQIQIETNGTQAIPALDTKPSWVHVTCSPKFENEYKIHPSLEPYLEEIKLVADSRLYDEAIKSCLSLMTNTSRAFRLRTIWLQPCWPRTDSVQTINLVKKYPKCRLGIQAHKYWCVE